MQGWNGSFPSFPPLDPSKYTSCYGVRLSGYVIVKKPSIQWDTYQIDQSFYNKYQVGLTTNLDGEALLAGSSSIVTCLQSKPCLSLTVLPTLLSS